MLMPRKPPKGFRKPHHPDRHGASKGGNRVVFGEDPCRQGAARAEALSRTRRFI